VGYNGSSSSGNGTVFRLAVTLPVGPPVIIAQPLDQTVLVGGTASFSVSASGSAPLRYFWRRNNVPIPGATQRTYTTNNVQLADSGSQFSCLVTNANGIALSSNAVLTVLTSPPDYFTELFASSQINGLAYQSFTFTPDGSANFYAVCRQSASVFPTDPTGGTQLTEGDDTYASITISGGNTVTIYNNRTNVIYVGSNGYLTMNSGDTSYSPSYTNHFALPRISALYYDLNASSGGTISWKQLTDRVAVTYQAVPTWGSSTQTNSFQVELFFNGRIRLTYLSLNAPSGLVGLSAGTGQPANFGASDFTAYGPCGTSLFVPGSCSHSTNGQFQFTLAGALGSQYEILTSTNLRDWSFLGTLVMTNTTSVFVDTNGRLPRCFYRALLAP